jgi:hypothetical protein
VGCTRPRPAAWGSFPSHTLVLTHLVICSGIGPYLRHENSQEKRHVQEKRSMNRHFVPHVILTFLLRVHAGACLIHPCASCAFAVDKKCPGVQYPRLTLSSFLCVHRACVRGVAPLSDGVLYGRTRRAGPWQPTVDHRTPLRLPGACRHAPFALFAQSTSLRAIDPSLSTLCRSSATRPSYAVWPRRAPRGRAKGY